MDITERWTALLREAGRESVSPKYVTVTMYGGQTFSGIVKLVDDATVTLKTHDSNESTIHVVDMHLIVAVTIRAQYP